ncbi:Uncharacterised protein [Mycobacterium tuberculosis]|uniref:Uncharacterized protein n=1 Tax=Mycobacterium tuberculosis TaxID=1773 RepID=A0A916LEE4_MYCTX|nr:Uncharacterised protein [Mycobacterium tuberculosis]
MAPRSSISMPSNTAVPMRGKRNSVNGSSQLVSNAMPCAQVGCDVGDVMNQEVRQ